MSTSERYALLRTAIANKQQAHFVYQKHAREVCPHAIGYGPSGNEQVLVYQFGGFGSKGPASSFKPEDRWRCISIDGISELAIVDGEWLSAANYSTPSTCVKEVDLEVEFERNAKA